MSIDRFGRQFFSVNSGAGGGRVTGGAGLGARGPPGEGFKLTTQGDYDINNKLLTNVGNPSSDLDAVNYTTLKGHVEPCLRLNSRKTKYNAQNMTIGSVAQPVDETDVVTLSYVKKKCVMFDDENGGDVVNMKEKRIRNVHYPETLADVATKGYVDSFTLGVEETMNYNFNAKSRLIKNLGEPKGASDAATKKYVDTNTLLMDPVGYRNFNAKRKVIKDLGNPSLPNDAVTKHYVDSKTLGLAKDSLTDYDANNRGIINVREPVQAGDAVNLGYLNKKCLQLEYDTIRKTPVWDAKGVILKNLWSPQNMEDAVNVDYLIKVLGDLIHYIYLPMSPIGDDIRTMSKNDWIEMNIKNKFFADIKKSG